MAKSGPSDLIHRVQAYTDKVNGANATTVLTARMDRMVAQQNQRIVQMYQVERNFKGYAAGAAIPLSLYAAYLAFIKKSWRICQKHVGLTQTGELTQQVNLFIARGCVALTLRAAALAVLGVTIP